MFLKLFEEGEDLHVYLLVDASASMRWTADRTSRHVSKLDLARQIAGALAYVGLANLDRVNVHYFSENLGADLGLGRGKSHFHRALQYLERPPAAAGQTNLARSLRAFGQKTKRRGLALILSDFFDPQGYEEALSYLLYQRFEVQLVQVLDLAELHPRLRGDLRLTDTETGQVHEVTANEGLLRAYEREVAAFLDGLDKFCRQRQIGYRRATTDVGFEDFVLRTLRDGGGLVA